MGTSQDKSIVDQILSAVDDQDCSIASYMLSTALEAANDDAPPAKETAREPVSDPRK